ncbi:flagellar biosynthesis anti-sigma factor FlgM [Salidesulfovibrio onnuriiensis]|uniref:flagellar biosynthesis anti-sigma factor FlgM n=1 Tax=Salidesulfovibrio onnuriiensis TaxID=2583823 RepID=UPI00202AC7D4|nr:flagellar biosynthesis anti-sigma factor FlgM [Salidesulfovibrio onnuriiensis]
MAMEIKNLTGEINPYSKKKVEQSRAEQDAKAAKSSGNSADKVVLSSEAKLRSTALQAANDAPDVRRKKVDELKAQVREGTYKPDIKKAAANLIRDDLDLLV